MLWLLSHVEALTVNIWLESSLLTPASLSACYSCFSKKENIIIAISEGDLVDHQDCYVFVHSHSVLAGR